MNEQTATVFKVQDATQIPDNIRRVAEDAVTKSRDAYTKLSVAAKDNSKALSEVVAVSQTGAKALSDKVVHNTAMNIEAAFDHAQALVRSASIPEAVSLQAKFVQEQIATASNQAKELFELYAKIAQQTFGSISVATTKSLDQLKKIN